MDMFGHSIVLNFERKGDTHKTKTGGCLSILCKLFLSYYVVSMFIKMIFKQDDQTLTNIGSQDLVETGEVSYTDLDMTIMHVIRK